MQAHTSGHLSLTPQRRVKKLLFLLLRFLSSPIGRHGRQQGNGAFLFFPGLPAASCPASHLLCLPSALSAPFPPWLSLTPSLALLLQSASASPQSLCCPSLPRPVSLCLSLPSQPPELANSCSPGRCEDRASSRGAAVLSQEPGWGLLYVKGWGVLVG